MKYKKVMSFLAVLSIIFSIIVNGGTVRAEETDYRYSVKADGTISITKYNGVGGKVVIPPQIYGKDVTSIDQYAFSSSAVTEVEIPNGVKTIWSGAFYGCNVLTKVTIPSSVITIDSCAFQRCLELTSITIPSSVTSIGYSVFAQCSKLTAICVDENNQNYKSVDGVLLSKDGTALIEYPNGKSGTEYQIPNNVTILNSYAFSWCDKLKDIVMPNSLITIGADAFEECTELTNAIIPNNVEEIGVGAFWDCHKLTNIKMTNSVEKLGHHAFYYCDGVTNITISNRITEIDSSVFEGCSKLTTITIPSNVTAINSYVFNRCSVLKAVYFCGNAPTIYAANYFGSFDECSPDFKIYYKANSKGFTSPTWNGYNTAVYAETADELKAGLVQGLASKQNSITLKYLGAVPDSSILYGDLDGNKVINSVDIELMMKFILGTDKSFPSADGLKAADLNGDGTVNSIDMAILKRFLSGLINKVPVPSEFDKQITSLIEATLNEDTNRYCVKQSNYSVSGESGNLTITFNFIYN